MKGSRQILCKSMQVVQSFDGLFGGPKSKDCSFIIDKNKYNVHIEQCMVRTYTISVENEICTINMWSAFLVLEKLIMLMEGRFYPVSELRFEGSSDYIEDYIELSKEYSENRLAYYSTSPGYCYHDHCFLDFSEKLDDKLMERWIDLQNELDIVNQVFLYNIADTGVTADVKCANLIELFEPLVEIINQNECFFPQLQPGEHGTTLKMCIDAVICKYGRDIFEQEYSHNKDAFLQILVRSRNRVMHIKRNQPCGKYLSGAESILYMTKICHLYRMILLILLGIPYQEFCGILNQSIAAWNQWENVLDHFIKTKL